MENVLVTKSGSLTESRRKFLEKTGASFVLASFGAAFFTSCSSSEDVNPTIPSTTVPPGSSTSGISISGNTTTINLSLQPALNTSGNWLLIENSGILVANVNGAFAALTSVCTHSGCDKNWTFGNNRFTCTCHNSIFDTQGKVLQGPANQPLTQFVAQVTGTTLTITK